MEENFRFISVRMCGTGTCEILVDSLKTSPRVKYINGDCVPSPCGSEKRGRDGHVQKFSFR